MAPSVVMCAMFILSTFFAIISIPVWDYVKFYSVEACLIIISGIAVFILTESVIRYYLYKKDGGCRFIASRCSANSWHFFLIPVWMLLGILLFNVGVVFWYYREILRIVNEYGKSTDNIVSSFREISVSLAVLEDSKIRMTGPILNQLLKVVSASGYIMAYVVINNFIDSKKYSWRLFLQVLVIISSQLPSFLNGGRGGLLRFLSAILIDYYILWHYRYGWQRNLSWKYVKIGIASLVIGLPIFYLWGRARGNGNNKTMIEYVAIYVGAPIQHFNQYIQKPIECMGLGEETLTDLRNLLYRIGFNIQAKNINLEMRWLNDRLRGNVYTFFRRPLHDFGLVGMYLFTALVAALFAWIYYAKIMKHQRTKYTDYWCLLYGYNYYWIIASSIVQLSHTVLSLNSILVLSAILIGFKIMTELKIAIKK